jgi:signal transduction histidine kinase
LHAAPPAILAATAAAPAPASGQWIAPALLGFGAGLLLASLAAMLLVRRHVRRMRAADARARRAERLAELGSMTRGLAHEIKNPLSTIGLNVQLLTEAVRDSVLPEEERAPLLRRLGALGREAERLRGILTDFLEYAGELRLDTREGDLNLTIDELIDFFMPQAQQQGVRLRSELAPGGVRACFDPAHVKQAVLNLMLNAVQAMGKQSAARELIVRTGSGMDEERRPTAVLHVIDTGPGISEEARRRIFDPYFTTKAGGSGLGLPTARRIIEAHGGRIDLHTEPGRGTDFTIVLPGVGREAAAPARHIPVGPRTTMETGDGSVRGSDH